MTTAEINKVLMPLIQNLVNKNFDEVYENDQNKRLSTIDMSNAIDSYLGIHTFPPKKAFKTYDNYDDESSSENLVEFDLWVDYKQSDLTLTVTIYNDGKYSIEDIHVL